MAGNKRTSSQMDNGNDNPSPKPLDEILAAANTDDLQDLFEIPDPPSEEDLAMLNAFDFQAPPIDDNNNNNNDNNGTVADPGNALVLQDPTQATQVEEAVATDANEQAITENTENTENTAEPAKSLRKRRRKGDPEPDHSALVREKSSKSKRCGQACDRCHIRRFKCDEVKGGCLMCLRSGIECKMTNRVTGKTMVRGGAEGVVINFDDIQRENEEVKEENEKLHDEIEQLRSVNGKLQSQLQYCYNKFSIGTVGTFPVPEANDDMKANIFQIPGPSHAPVSDPSRILPNPNPQAQAMQQSSQNFLYGNQTNKYNGNTQPVASNYNNNAFSGNKSIASSAPLPIPSSMLNALSHSEWAQPHPPHGFPTASRNNMVTYPPLSQVQAPMRDDTAQGVSFQGANGQDAQDTNAYVQGTSHSLKTLNQDFQVAPQYLTRGAQNQTSHHESKNVQHQDFPNAKLPYKTAHDYPLNFPQPAPQSYLQPVVRFQGARQGAKHQKANNHIPSFLDDPLSRIKSEDDTAVKFDLEPGFSWTAPLPATFPSLDLDTAANQTSTANLGDASTNFFALNDSNNAYQAQDLSDPEILGLLESLAQQKQSQPPVHKRVQELCSDNVGVKTEGPSNYDGGSDCFLGSSQGFDDVGPFV
ncbi:putative C6 finger domain protein [Aspergillus glaucus CBS 516.65]|uniref:Zn(2)-C6 fungal-type domain-containing protein n=1 Tax=Aspergillus glaucus CBS 516.65 TaxID=1160497 RepID=A0A1L9VSP6_ASPGL|nr:hypothetical protein ASPGLDRAFT_79869 [Aspergillus glaucus CBS 516.65]OJJ86920.1 hypothetical protein ASPGLDRAFT_79869 [Aspergillus glaucus CBS 516.65]